MVEAGQVQDQAFACYAPVQNPLVQRVAASWGRAAGVVDDVREAAAWRSVLDLAAAHWED